MEKQTKKPPQNTSASDFKSVSPNEQRYIDSRKITCIRAMKVRGYSLRLFSFQSINHKSIWKKKSILQEKQTRAILRWLQSCLIVHEDL